MATNVQGREITYSASGCVERHGEKIYKESAMAKAYSSKVAVDNSLEAIQIHGGYGYVREYIVERFFA